MEITTRLGLRPREFHEALEKADEVEFGIERDRGNVVTGELEDHYVKPLHVDQGNVVGVLRKHLNEMNEVE